MGRGQIISAVPRGLCKLPPKSIGRRFGGRARIGFVVSIAALALVVGWACLAMWGQAPRTPADDEDDATRTAVRISTTRARTLLWTDEVVASGAIVPWQEAALASPISGLRVAEVVADVGDHVRKGQVLARLDDALLQADAQRLRAALVQSEALSLQARRDAERATAVRARGVLSEQSILQAMTQSETAVAAVHAARAMLSAKRIEIENAVLRAPDDGVISERAATPGAVPQDGEALFRLIRQQRLEWRGEVTAAQLSAIGNGQAVELTLADGRRAEATVRQTSPVLGTDSRMGLVFADLRAGSSARAGMFVEGRIASGASNARVVPAAAVVIRDGRSCVFAVPAGSASATASSRPVTVGRRRGGLVEIVSGVSEGDIIAHAGAAFLADGDLVSVIPVAAATALPNHQGAIQR